MVFKIKDKPWFNMCYNSLTCHKPKGLIDPIKGDVIKFENKAYAVDRIVCELLFISPN